MGAAILTARSALSTNPWRGFVQPGERTVGAADRCAFFSYALIDTLGRLGVSWSIMVVINSRIRLVEAIDESAWRTIF
jgi:hypothetical protein